MITAAELHQHAAEEGLRFDQIEKDYVILWLLKGLAGDEVLKKGQWIFKGGTCLRHCYYKGYRFSEDIDFSCEESKGGSERAAKTVQSVLEGVQDRSGIRLQAKTPLVGAGDFQVEIPVEYSRGGQRRQSLPCVKIHLTFDEPILTRVRRFTIRPGYQDIASFTAPAYSKLEIAAEKMRALLQQQKKWPRPRDLYDLWYMFSKAKERLPVAALQDAFEAKCQVRDIKPDPRGLVSEQLREWNRNAWLTILAPMMREVPDYELVWAEWNAIHARLFPGRKSKAKGEA